MKYWAKRMYLNLIWFARAFVIERIHYRGLSVCRSSVKILSLAVFLSTTVRRFSLHLAKPRESAKQRQRENAQTETTQQRQNNRNRENNAKLLVRVHIESFKLKV